jgi:hypothetical protein
LVVHQLTGDDRVVEPRDLRQSVLVEDGHELPLCLGEPANWQAVVDYTCYGVLSASR